MASVAISDKRKALLAHKEKLLQDIKYYECRINDEQFDTSKLNVIEGDSSDSDSDIPQLDSGPSIAELKQQRSTLHTCVEATQELTALQVIECGSNVMVEDPVVDGRTPITEPGVWREVMAECCIDLIHFSISFYAHKPNRKYGPVSHLGLQVTLAKQPHEVELSKSVLSTLKRPADAVEVLRSYAAAYRSRRSTLARLADMFARKLHMEPLAEGGYLLKCANLLELQWTLQNKWSPIAPFHHRMKFDLEYMDESYIERITASHRQLSEPDVDTEERTQLLAHILAACLGAARAHTQEQSESASSDPEAGRLEKRRTTLDREPEQPSMKKKKGSEVMAPPRTVPKKVKKTNKAVKDKSDVTGVQGQSMKRPGEDTVTGAVKKAKTVRQNDECDGKVEESRYKVENVAEKENVMDREKDDNDKSKKIEVNKVNKKRKDQEIDNGVESRSKDTNAVVTSKTDKVNAGESVSKSKVKKTDKDVDSKQKSNEKDVPKFKNKEASDEVVSKVVETNKNVVKKSTKQTEEDIDGEQKSAEKVVAKSKKIEHSGEVVTKVVETNKKVAKKCTKQTEVDIDGEQKSVEKVVSKSKKSEHSDEVVTKVDETNNKVVKKSNKPIKDDQKKKESKNVDPKSSKQSHNDKVQPSDQNEKQVVKKSKQIGGDQINNELKNTNNDIKTKKVSPNDGNTQGALEKPVTNTNTVKIKKSVKSDNINDAGNTKMSAGRKETDKKTNVASKDGNTNKIKKNEVVTADKNNAVEKPKVLKPINKVPSDTDVMKKAMPTLKKVASDSILSEKKTADSHVKPTAKIGVTKVLKNVASEKVSKPTNIKEKPSTIPKNSEKPTKPSNTGVAKDKISTNNPVVKNLGENVKNTNTVNSKTTLKSVNKPKMLESKNAKDLGAAKFSSNPKTKPFNNEKENIGNNQKVPKSKLPISEMLKKAPLRSSPRQALAKTSKIKPGSPSIAAKKTGVKPPTNIPRQALAKTSMIKPGSLRIAAKKTGVNPPTNIPRFIPKSKT